jgi:hypothetical protein
MYNNFKLWRPRSSNLIKLINDTSQQDVADLQEFKNNWLHFWIMLPKFLPKVYFLAFLAHCALAGVNASQISTPRLWTKTKDTSL